MPSPPLRLFAPFLKFAQNLLAHLALVSLIFQQFIFSASAQNLPINPDGSTNTQVTQTASGVDQINIAAPNAAGLSHNKFTDYNVNAAGQVINNFSGAGASAGSGANAVTSTQIGGLVTANPNLVNSASAKVILNEVTSNNTSQLLGYTEIAGAKADLILANPNGITCSGCGFINTARLFMVAGSSNFDSNGNLGFNLKEQANPNLYVPLITIDGLGLDASRTSSTDIIASSVKLLSTIYGSDNTALTIKSGEGGYDFNSKEISGNNVQNNTQPVFAIDASSLAKIQSGQVYLIATKQGVGVNMEAEILASSTVHIDANGDVYYSKISAGEAASLASTQKIHSNNSNSSISAPTINITANEFKNLGLVSAYNLNIQNSGTLNNLGNIEALRLNLSNITNINNSGSIYGENSLSISGINLTNDSSGSIFSPQSYSLVLTGLLTNSGLINSRNNLRVNSNQLTNSAEISAGNNLTFVIADYTTNSGNLISGNALNLTANSLDNSGATQSGDYSNFNLVSLTNSETASLYSAKNLTLNLSSSLTNSGKISALENFAITGTSAITNSNQLLSNSDLNIMGSSLNNSSGAIIASLTASLTLVLTGDLQNDGELDSTNDLTASATNFSNSGNILGNTNLVLSSANNFTNSGILQSGSATEIATSSLNNSGLIKSFATVTVNADEITNQTSGGITSENFNLTSSVLTNLGTIYSANILGITNSSDLINSGTLYSEGSLSLSANNLTNSDSGFIFSAANSALTSLVDFTNSGEISAANDLTVNASSDVTNSGNILSNGSLVIAASNLTNDADAAIASLASTLTLTSSDDLQNNGQISSDADLNISSKNLTNVGDILSGNKLTVTATNAVTNSGNFQSISDFLLISAGLDNSGEIKSFGAGLITANVISNQTEALIFLNSDATITSSTSFTNSGSILSNGEFDLTAVLATNSSEIFSTGDLTLTLTNTFTNSGSLSSISAIDVSSTSSIANTNQILSGRNLSLNLASLTNSSNIVSGGNFDITISGSIDNSGNLESADNITINAAGFTNSDSSLILSGKDLTIRASSITNQNTKPSTSTITSGIVSANGNILLQTDTLNNNSGLIAGKSTVVNTLNATSVNLYNTLGAFISTAAISLNLGTLDYTITGTVTADNVDITASNIINQGNVTASDYIKLTATGISGSGNITNGFSSGDNSNVQLAAGTYVELTAKNNINNYGTISANTDLTLTSTNGQINNYKRIIGGDGETTINVANSGFTNFTSSAVITSNNNLTFNTNDLTNSGEISVANNLTANITNNLYNNPSALIWSGSDATFNVANSLVNNQSDIYANNNLTIQKNTSVNTLLNKASLVQNISGNIETYAGDITISATTLTNQRSSMKTQSYTYWQSGCNFHNHECHYDSGYIGSVSGTVGANSSITSGSDLSLNLGTLNNNSASILAVKDIQIDAPTINNISNTFESYQNRVNDWWGPYNPYNWVTTYKPSTMSSESYAAFIKAGGSLVVTQNGSTNTGFVNGTNVTKGSSVSSTSSQLRSTTINHVDIYKLGQSGALSIDLSGISSAISGSGYVNNGSDFSLTSSPTSVAASVVNTSSVSASSATISSSSLTASGSSTVFSGNFKINLDSSATTPLVESRSQFTDISKFFGSSYYFNQLGLNGSAVLADIDRQTRNSTATRVLGDSFVETKLILDQLKSLTNDSLFLSKDTSGTISTADSNQQIKELLDNSIAEFARLGLNAKDVAIRGLTTSQANSLIKDVVTFETTKVNGISVLAPKIYLSQDTRSRLLGTDASLATNATLFAKTDLTIDSPLSNMTNNASIVSGGNLTLNVGSLTNASISFGGLSGGIASVAKIKSGGDLTIVSNTTAPSISGMILQNSLLDSGGEISLTASNSISIANDQNFTISSFGYTPSSSTVSISAIQDDASTSRSALAFNSASDIQLTSLSSINIANNYFNTGGSIYMTATDDINNSNYTIKASDNVVMSAGNDINNIHTTSNSNETRIEAGSIVSLDAGNDINNIGATIKGGSLVYLTAGNDINNQALINYTINGSSTNSDGSTITESQALASSERYIGSSLVSQGNIESGGNLVMVAANDINNKGSNITSTEASYLEATNGSINITTAALRDKTFAEGGSKKKHWVSITDNTTNIESNITSSGSLDLVASGTTAAASALASEIGNINITGSTLTSADNLTLAAKNDISIQSAQDSTYSFAAGRIGKGKSYLNRSSSTTQIESELTTTNNGDISITSGVDNTDTVGATDAKGSISLIASKLTTKDSDADSSNNSGSGNITLAAKEDLTISSALTSEYSESFSAKKGTTVKKSSTQIDGSSTNVSSELDAAGDITTTSGDDTNIIASNLTSAGSGSITSGGETNIFNGVDTTTHYSNIVKERKGILNQNPLGAAVIKTLQVVSGGYYNGISGGNLDKGDGLWGNSKDRVDVTSTTEKIVTSNLNFANDLSINSDQDLAVRSSNLTSSSGDISLTSNLGNVSITAATANNTSNWLANNKTDRSKATEERVNNTGTVTSAEITAGKNITITSAEGDVTLQAAKLTSGTAAVSGSQDLVVNASNGNIYLLAASDTSEVTHTNKSKGTYSFSDGTSGHINNTIINNEIRADGGNTTGTSGTLTFNTNNSIIAQYKNTGSGTDTSVFASSPSLAYLNNLDPTQTIYNPIDETHIDWDQTTRGLTKAGTAVVAIAVVAIVVAVTVLTAGTGTAAAASAGTAATAGGGAAAGGTAAAAGAGAATAGAGAGVAAGGTVAAAGSTMSWATIGSAALNASGMTALTTASISGVNASMNADGDVFKQLKTVGKTSFKDTTSSDSLRNIAISGITAGFAEYASQASSLKQLSDSINAANAVSGTTTAQRIMNNIALSLAESAVSNGTSSIIQSTVNGDSTSDTLGDLAVNIGVGAVANLGAKEIGNAAHSGAISRTKQLTLHAGLGCLSGAAQGGDCASGAAAGVIGEMAGNNLRSSVEDGSISKQTAIQLAGLSGSTAALITSAATGQSDEQMADNIFAGQRIGSNAAENNALMPHEKKALVEELNSCGNNQSCKNQVQAKYEAISKPRDEEFDQAISDCDDGRCDKLKELHYDLRLKLTEEGNEYFWNHTGEFKLLPQYQSVYHTFIQDPQTGEVLSGQNNNIKYVHPILGYEVVLNQNNKIVTDPLNMGTYNFYNPSSDNSLLGGFFLHKDYDVKPYKLLGNSKNDPTNEDHRGFISGIMRNFE